MAKDASHGRPVTVLTLADKTHMEAEAGGFDPAELQLHHHVTQHHTQRYGTQSLDATSPLHPKNRGQQAASKLPASYAKRVWCPKILTEPSHSIVYVRQQLRNCPGAVVASASPPADRHQDVKVQGKALCRCGLIEATVHGCWRLGRSKTPPTPPPVTALEAPWAVGL
jgi:hypothetical protein